MSYTGRLEARVLKEGCTLEVLSVDVRLRRGVRWDLIIDDGDYDHEILKAAILDLLKGRSDGVWDIAGTYHEHYAQDYWGEWDGDFWLERERVKLVGSFPPAVARPTGDEKGDSK